LNSKAGKLLIAHPNLSSNNPWYKTVIYLFDDDTNGSKGLVVNKASSYRVSDFFSSRGMILGLTKETMRYGGPVATKTILMLHTDEWYSSSTGYAKNGVAISCDDFMLEKMSMNNQPELWRMCVGLCSWQPGQLDQELEGKYPYRPENSWLTADADPSILFECDGDKQWEKALAVSSRQLINQYF